jgi:hypothetical protein
MSIQIALHAPNQDPTHLPVIKSIIHLMHRPKIVNFARIETQNSIEAERVGICSQLQNEKKTLKNKHCPPYDT